MSRVIIVHKEHGVFVGNFLGLALWSKCDDGDQDEAVTFKDNDQAVDFISSWSSIPADLELVKIESAPDYGHISKNLITEYW